MQSWWNSLAQAEVYYPEGGWIKSHKQGHGYYLFLRCDDVTFHHITLWSCRKWSQHDFRVTASTFWAIVICGLELRCVGLGFELSLHLPVVYVHPDCFSCLINRGRKWRFICSERLQQAWEQTGTSSSFTSKQTTTVFSDYQHLILVFTGRVP